MVKITDGKRVIGVTSGAFNNFYKGTGWAVVTGEELPVAVVDSAEGNTADKVVVEDVVGLDEAATVSAKVDVEAHLTEELPEIIVINGLTKEELLEIPVNDMSDLELSTAAEVLGLNLPQGTSNKKAKKAVNEGLKG